MKKRKVNKIHRRVYEQYHGIKIPKNYHIHHIDGNPNNNDISNLQCVSIQEHFDIHWEQKDYGACWALTTTGHLTLTPEQRSELSRQQLKYQWTVNRDKMLNGRRNRPNSDLVGRTWKLTEEQSKKVSKHLIRFNSETASICKNTIWINNGIKNKRVKGEIPQGWTKGRLFVPWNKKGVK